MMMVPCYLAPSAIHGLGVFANAPITAGALVWQHIDGIDLQVPMATIKAQPQAVQDYFNHYGHLDPDQPDFFFMCSGHGRFMNHADDANTVDTEQGIFATRAIAVGEEITGNYLEYGGAHNANWELIH